MMKRVVYYVFTLCLPMSMVVSLKFKKSDNCTTPNGEIATCVPISSCPGVIGGRDRDIKDSRYVYTSDSEAKDFVLDSGSGCRYYTDSLVCCGSIVSNNSNFKCITPEGELASCRPLSTCKIILDAIKTRSKEAIEYAKKSQCGYENEPLVCCGSQSTASIVSSFFPNAKNCGFSQPWIISAGYGGSNTKLNEHPWMALLRYRYNDGGDAGFKCGGTLINERYVLTAAHCVIINTMAGFDLDSVRLGEWRISTEIDCEQMTCADEVVDLKIEKEIVHQSYARRKGKHDIALLRLERNVATTDNIYPVCLPPPEAQEPKLGTILSMIGWGETENGSSSDVKLIVKLPLVNRSVCVAKIRSRQINEDQLCAGGEGGRDSCFGDSGGPLLREKLIDPSRDLKQWHQEGIVSFGVVCGFPGIPAVYTRVSRYITWMIENMSAF